MDEGISLGLVVALVEEATGADPAVIEQAVQDWLDDHPEATTTVADGSITEQKLAAAVAAKINQVNQLSDEIDGIRNDLSASKTLTGMPVVIKNASSADMVDVASTDGTNVYITGENVLDFSDITVGSSIKNPKNLCIPFTVYLDFDVSADFAQSTKIWVMYIAWKDGTKRYISYDSNSSVRTLTASIENPIVEFYERSTNVTAGSITNIRATRNLGSAYTAYNGKSAILPASDVALYSGNNLIWTDGNDCTVDATIADGRIESIESVANGVTGATVANRTIAYTAGTAKYDLFGCEIAENSRVKFRINGDIFSDICNFVVVFLDAAGNTVADRQGALLGVEYELTLGADVAQIRTYVTGEYILTSGNAILTVRVMGHAERIVNLESYHANELAKPNSYYFANDYLPDKIATINGYAKSAVGNGDAFIFITDQHWLQNAQESPALIKYIADNTHINTVFNGGDVADGGSDDYVNMLRSTGIDDIFYANGNHEGLRNTNGDALAYMFDMYNSGKQISGNAYERYFYVDNNRAKIRYVVLSTNNDGGTEDIDADQLAWFTGTALNVETGWNIIIIIHYLYMINWANNAISVADAAAGNVVTAIDAYSGNGKIIAVFQGHVHRDRVTTTPGGVPVIITTCDKWVASESNGNTDIDVTRTKGTITEQAFDVVIVDVSAKTIHAVRIGAPARDGVGSSAGSEVQERTITWS